MGNLFSILANFLTGNNGSNAPTHTPRRNNSAFSGSRQTGHYAPRGGWLDTVEDSGTSSGTSRTIFDPQGNVITLGAKDEKGSGGEGTVYELPLNSKFLVKIYREEILRDTKKMVALRSRIIDMVNLKACAQMPFVAWPIMPVMDAQKQIIGFVMRKCTGSSLLTLRGPRFIRQRFPRWTRRELALTALDYVKKVQFLAANNVFINDFNPANFLVNDRCEVSFIDCDSFQVPGRNGVHVTKTFFPSHTAPELLKDKRLLEQPRTIHQVEFGAALTIFNLLMCGLHPYNYCDPNHKSACGTPDENLLKGRCPLGIDSDCMLPLGGWRNLWSWLTYSLKSLFITMFKDGHSNPDARPTLKHLQSELEALLTIMKKDPERTELEPTKAKSREYKGTGPCPSQIRPGRNF